MRLLVIGLASALVAGCGGPADPSAGGSARSLKDSSYEVASDAAASADDATAAAPVAGDAPSATVPVGAPMLAYSYQYGIETPARKVRELAARHEAACAGAGPTQCQVTNAMVQENDNDNLQAELKLRAAPAWLKRFRAGLTDDARSAGGRVASSNVSSEDLSRQIVDTEARLRAMTTLRDRLQALLADRPGKLSDLVEIERELARVQGEIDSTTSQLAVMRGRVAMSEVTLSYQSLGVLAPRGVWSPLTNAFTDFISIVAFTLAAMVRLVAWLLPWVLVGGGLLWLFRKRLPAKLRLPWRRREPGGQA